MKIIYVGLILVLIVLAGIGYFIRTPTVTPTSTLTIAVKDAPKQSSHGTITSLVLIFSEVSVHKAVTGETIDTTAGEINTTESNQTEESGWIKVVDTVQTVDLLQFTDVSKILGEKTLDSGKYTQIRLKIDSGTATINGNTYDLIVPSTYLKLNRGFELEPNANLKLTLDFKAEKSLVRTGNNKFILKPVIAVISETPVTTTTGLTTASTTIPTTTIPMTTTVSTTTQTTIPVTGNGILLMKIKDKLDLTNVTAIDITINKVEVHKGTSNENATQSNETFETNDTSTAGWITITDETKSYNLLELVNTPGEVMGNKTLSAGKYTQIRLYVSNAEITLNNNTYDAKVPSSRFYWVHPFDIETGKITTLTLDFDSIVETGNKKFILKPVVKISSEFATTTTTTSSSTTSSTSSSSSTSTTSTTTLNTTTSSILNTTSTTIETTSSTTTTISENTTTTI